MLLPRRFLVSREQPYALASNLQNAVVVGRDNILRPPSKIPRYAQRSFRTQQPLGVPHGVKNAIVLVKDLRVEWFGSTPRIYFCDSHDYLAVAETILDGDEKDYPNPDETLISTSCHVPWENGLYHARLRIALNGRPNIHVETFRYELATLASV